MDRFLSRPLPSLSQAALLALVVVGSGWGSPAQARQRTVIEQIAPEFVDQAFVQSVEVQVGETAADRMAKLEAIAAEKRASAGLPAYAANSARPLRDTYATLPFAAMMPLVMQDVTRKWGLTLERGKPVRLKVTIENIKMANAGMAILLGSSDELSGEVQVFDAASDRQIGDFYVQVVNGHGGLAGMALRGSGVREKLVEEFALESARILTGSTKKDWKKRIKGETK